MNQIPDGKERRHLHTERITALHKLALSTDEAERKVAQRTLREIDAEIAARELAESQDDNSSEAA